MTDLRPAQDVAAAFTQCREIEHEFGSRCAAHWDEWPCPRLTLATAVIEADRKAAMAKAWDEGYDEGWGHDDYQSTAGRMNPYEAADE